MKLLHAVRMDLNWGERREIYGRKKLHGRQLKIAKIISVVKTHHRTSICFRRSAAAATSRWMSRANCPKSLQRRWWWSACPMRTPRRYVIEPTPGLFPSMWVGNHCGEFDNTPINQEFVLSLITLHYSLRFDAIFAAACMQYNTVQRVHRIVILWKFMNINFR